MAELYLKYRDENELEKEILVENQDFFLGRHSDNDLAVANPKLSRTHAKIERYDDVYLLSDFDSSNGTKLNDFKVTEPTKLKNGDIIDLGGGLIIEVDYVEDLSDADPPAIEISAAPNAEVAATARASSSSSVEAESGVSMKLFALLAVSFLFVLLIVVGGAAFFFGGKSNTDTARTDGDPAITFPNDPTSVDPVTEPNSDPVPNDTSIPEPVPAQPNGEPGEPAAIDTSDPVIDTAPPAPETKTDSDKAEAAALLFMRKIARNDPTPVLTRPQLSVIAQKASQFAGSSALASNMQDAKRSSSDIATLAASKDMKPQFLATVALAQLGNRKGDVAATARSMIEVLGNVQREVGAGNETANDSLLTVAAYDVGQAGDERKFRDMISRLTQESSNSPRQIRTIWFLKDKGKISNAQFEFALRFLAIGTITQNPKAYSVNAEALSLN